MGFVVFAYSTPNNIHFLCIWNDTWYIEPTSFENHEAQQRTAHKRGWQNGWLTKNEKEKKKLTTSPGQSIDFVRLLPSAHSIWCSLRAPAQRSWVGATPNNAYISKQNKGFQGNRRARLTTISRHSAFTTSRRLAAIFQRCIVWVCNKLYLPEVLRPGECDCKHIGLQWWWYVISRIAYNLCYL